MRLIIAAGVQETDFVEPAKECPRIGDEEIAMSVVMLSGPVASGKTTVARELVAISPAPLCYLEGDAFWPVFAKPGTKSRREQFQLLMRSITAAARPLARGGFDVLLDFSFPLEFLETARKILKEIPLDFVMLRPSLAICEQRAAARPEGKIADYGVYRDFYTMFEGLPKHEVSNDEVDPGILARRIREGLDLGIFRLD